MKLTDIEFNNYWKQVEGTAHKFCRKYHISGFAYEDLVQEARMELHSTLLVFDENKGASLNTYFYHRLRQRLQNLLNMAKAKKNKYNHFEHASYGDDLIKVLVNDGRESPEDVVLRQEREKELYDLVHSLHPILRDDIIAKIKGKTNKEIADKQGLSPQAILQRFKLIHNFLKTRPNKKEIEAFNAEYERRMSKRHGTKGSINGSSVGKTKGKK